MERIMYRKTLDVHKNGIQFLLQGFETADNLSRVIEISLMASGDAIDFPLEKIEALMYVTTPGATEPSINKCTIKDNKVVYEVLPIVEEGITNMQLKIIETSVDGATGILASPKFAVEVTKSDADDSGAEQTTTFTALEDAMAKAKSVYEERFLRMELSSDCLFRAYYADGTIYETDVLQRLFLNGNVLLSESFAHGGTGVRAGEDTDNSKYYSNVSKSEMLKAKDIMENSEEILEEVKLHGVYTAFSVDFETGEIEYISPSFKFKVNLESGELDAIGQTYKFEDELGRVVEKWLLANKIVLSDLQAISTTHTDEIEDLKSTTETHTDEIACLKETDSTHSMDISNLKQTTTTHTNEITELKKLKTRVTPVELGGTGATTIDGVKSLLSIDKITPLSSYLAFAGNVNKELTNAALGMNNEDEILEVGKALAMYAKFKDSTVVIDEKFSNLINCDRLSDINDDVIEELNTSVALRSLFTTNTYAWDNCIVKNSKNIVYKKGDESAGISFSNGTVIYQSDMLLSKAVDRYATVTTNNIPTNGGRYLYIECPVSGCFEFKLLDKNGNARYTIESGTSYEGVFDVSTLDEIVLSFRNVGGSSAQNVGISNMIISNFKPTGVTVYEEGNI